MSKHVGQTSNYRRAVAAFIGKTAATKDVDQLVDVPSRGTFQLVVESATDRAVDDFDGIRNRPVASADHFLAIFRPILRYTFNISHDNQDPNNGFLRNRRNQLRRER